MPLLNERVQLLRTASNLDPIALVDEADRSAARLVNLLTSTLPDHFSDTAIFADRTVSLHKRAQILVADLWACFRGTSFGEFADIDTALTMFADYRIPQMLQRFGVLRYSPRLESKIRRKEVFESGEAMEVEVRGCSVWAVELLRREIVRKGGQTWEVEVEEEEEEEDDEAEDSNAMPPVAATATGDNAAQARTKAEESLTGNHLATLEKHDDVVVHPPEDSTMAPARTAAQDKVAEQPEMHSGPEDAPSFDPAAVSSVASVDTPQPTATTEPNTTPHPKESKKTTKKLTVHLNAILLDYLLYDTAKQLEAEELASQSTIASSNNGATANQPVHQENFDPDGPKTLPHHRCRSIWY